MVSDVILNKIAELVSDQLSNCRAVDHIVMSKPVYSAFRHTLLGRYEEYATTAEFEMFHGMKVVV